MKFLNCPNFLGKDKTDKKFSETPEVGLMFVKIAIC